MRRRVHVSLCAPADLPQHISTVNKKSSVTNDGETDHSIIMHWHSYARSIIGYPIRRGKQSEHSVVVYFIDDCLQSWMWCNSNDIQFSSSASDFRHIFIYRIHCLLFYCSLTAIYCAVHSFGIWFRHLVFTVRWRTEFSFSRFSFINLLCAQSMVMPSFGLWKTVLDTILIGAGLLMSRFGAAFRRWLHARSK